MYDVDPLNNRDISSIDIDQNVASYDQPLYGDECYDSSMYYNVHHHDSVLTPSPKKSKKLPTTGSSTHQKPPSTPSIITAAGAGLSSLFSSLSNTIHTPVVTTSSSYLPLSAPIVTSNSMLPSIYTPTSYSFNSSQTGIKFPSSISTSFSNSYTTELNTPKTYSDVLSTLCTTSSYTSCINSTVPSYMSSSVSPTPTLGYLSNTNFASSRINNSTLAEIYTPEKSYDLLSSLSTLPQSVNVSSSSHIGPISFSTSDSTTTPISSPYFHTSLYNTTTSSSSLYTPTTTTSYSLSSSSYGTASSIYNPVSSYNATMNLGIIGHSPIPEEETENDVALEESYMDISTYTPFKPTNDYKISTSLTSCPNSSALISEGFNLTTSSCITNISDSFYATASGDVVEEESFLEEYREDYEEDFEISMPEATTSHNMTSDMMVKILHSH